MDSDSPRHGEDRTARPVSEPERQATKLDFDGSPAPAAWKSEHYCYWITDAYGNFRKGSERDLKRYLTRRIDLQSQIDPNLPDKAQKARYSKLLEDLGYNIQQYYCVDYAGPLAGHKAGLYRFNGKLLLATNSPIIVEPKEGDFSKINQLTERLFGNEQRPYIESMIQISMNCLESQNFRKCPVSVLVGEKDIGKSFWQKYIWTALVGGRHSDPLQFILHDTSFNKELFGCESIIIEDATASTDIRSRRAMAEHFRRFAANDSHSCHGKNLEKIQLAPFWRVTMSVNTDLESLHVLPPWSDELSDKVSLFWIYKGEMPMPTATAEQTTAFRMAIESQLPAYKWHLQKQFKIPGEIVGGRFGIKTYQHPKVMELLNQISEEIQLLELIDKVLFPLGVDPVTEQPTRRTTEWVGNATSLEQELMNSVHRDKAKKLLQGNTVKCGTLYAKLCRYQPDRFKSWKSYGYQVYRIQAPEIEVIC